MNTTEVWNGFEDIADDYDFSVKNALEQFCSLNLTMNPFINNNNGRYV